jgi:hypothetical protein
VEGRESCGLTVDVGGEDSERDMEYLRKTGFWVLGLGTSNDTDTQYPRCTNYQLRSSLKREKISRKFISALVPVDRIPYSVRLVRTGAVGRIHRCQNGKFDTPFRNQRENTSRRHM